MKRMLITTALAVGLTLAGSGFASAEGQSERGRCYGQFHADQARTGDPGLNHKPGMHRGITGFPGCQVD